LNSGFFLVTLFFCFNVLAVPNPNQDRFNRKAKDISGGTYSFDGKKYPKLAPRQLNRQVQHWLSHFTTSEKSRIGRFFFRGSRYKKVIQAMLVDNNLPKELYYLAILESGFVVDARSHAGATGTWQFMKPTAIENGLMVNRSIDERLDPMRSTIAAMKYLKSLKKQYGDWKIALAAYNCGPKKVNRAIRIVGRDFWEISRRKLIPRETRNYVPQFLSLAYIGKNPKKYGFKENSARFHNLAELVYLPSPLRLVDLSKASGLSVHRLKKLNPHLKSGMTPKFRKNYGVWVPKSYAKKVSKLKKVLAKRSRSNLARSSNYKVKPGENLSLIAKKFKISTRDLMEINGLSSDHLVAGQKLSVSAKNKKTFR